MQLKDKYTLQMYWLESCHAAHIRAAVYSYYGFQSIDATACETGAKSCMRTHCCVGHQPRDMAFVSWWTGCRRCRTGGSPGQTCGPPPARAQAPDTSDWTISPDWPGRSDPGAHQPEFKTKLSIYDNPQSMSLQRELNLVFSTCVHPTFGREIYVNSKQPPDTVKYTYNIIHRYVIVKKNSQTTKLRTEPLSPCLRCFSLPWFSRLFPAPQRLGPHL